MKRYPAIMLVVKDLKERKYRYLAALILLFMASGLFFIPRILNYDTGYTDIVTELLPIYTLNYPAMAGDVLKIIILTDISLPFIILVPAFASPFLGALEGLINEKENRTLEVLLSLPVSDLELLIGKMGASLFMGICLTWIMFLTHAILIGLMLPIEVSYHLWALNWLVLVFLVAPLISIVVNSLGIILAIQVKNLNTAAYLGIVVLSPFFSFLFLVTFGKIVLGVGILLKISCLLVVASLGSIVVAKRHFNRETLILRF